MGVGAARVRDLFEQAKQKAPCIIFVDELDALGKARGIGPVTHEEREQTLNQLLVELDGFDARGRHPDGRHQPPGDPRPGAAARRPIRCHVLVDRPDRIARLEILKLHASKVPVESPRDLEVIAAMTAGFVGADLANIINEAALLGVRRDRDRVGMPELQEAVERIVAGLEKKNACSPPPRRSGSPTTSWNTRRRRFLPHGEGVHKISIIPAASRRSATRCRPRRRIASS